MTGDASALARALIVDPSGEAARTLAEAVLDTEAVRLALEVRAGGPHAVRRAIELAALILSASTERRATESETG